MKKYIYKIEQDNDPESPREWDNLGTMVCFHNRYNLGDKTDYRSKDYNSWDELKQGIITNEGEVVILPLYLYDHSGITISTSPFNCNWDSGQVGFIFVSKYKIKKEGIDEDKVEEYLKSEVKTYDNFLTGEVYAYRIFEQEECSKGHLHEEQVEYCGGYYSEEDATAEAKSMLEDYMKEPA